MDVDTLNENCTQGKPFLLDHFALSQRSGIANQFFSAYRSGAETPGAVLLSVKGDVLRRILTQEGDRLKTQQLLLSLLESGEANAYAQQVVERECLSPAEKERLKSERQEHHRREYLKAQPATERQIGYLKSLGCLVGPANRWEASQMIEQHK